MHHLAISFSSYEIQITLKYKYHIRLTLYLHPTALKLFKITDSDINLTMNSNRKAELVFLVHIWI